MKYLVGVFIFIGILVLIVIVMILLIKLSDFLKYGSSVEEASDKQLQNRLEQIGREDKNLSDFYKFECSKFFKGRIQAELNEKKAKEWNDEILLKEEKVRTEMEKRGLK